MCILYTVLGTIYNWYTHISGIHITHDGHNHCYIIYFYMFIPFRLNPFFVGMDTFALILRISSARATSLCRERCSVCYKFVYKHQPAVVCCLDGNIQYLLKTTGHFAQRATIVFACKYLIAQLYCNNYAQAGTFNVII